MLVNDYREPVRRRPVGAERLLWFQLVNSENWLFHGESNPEHFLPRPRQRCLDLDHESKGWAKLDLAD
jgi:hypothetical protein